MITLQQAAVAIEKGPVVARSCADALDNHHADICKASHSSHECANVFRQLDVMQCRYLSHTLTAAAGLHTARRGSGWIRSALQPSAEVLH
jgi:hypothetical protein